MNCCSVRPRRAVITSTAPPPHGIYLWHPWPPWQLSQHNCPSPQPICRPAPLAPMNDAPAPCGNLYCTRAPHEQSGMGEIEELVPEELSSPSFSTSKRQDGPITQDDSHWPKPQPSPRSSQSKGTVPPLPAVHLVPSP